MVNYSGIFAIPSVLFKPGLILPHVSVKDIRYLDWKALKSLGIKSVVFDKDNCLTKPLQDQIVPQLEKPLLECIKTFGFKNVVILSNSSGSSDDPNSIGAESLSRNLLSNSKIQVMLHENKKPSTSCAKEVFDWFSGNHQLTSGDDDLAGPKILLVGDRPTTDIITGHRISHVFRKHLDIKGKTIDAKETEIQDPRKGGDNPCLTVLTTDIWERERLGTRLMRSLEYKMVRYLVTRGIEPGSSSWKTNKRKPSETQSKETSVSKSTLPISKVGLGLVSNDSHWQSCGIVRSSIAEDVPEKISKELMKTSSIDVSTENGDLKPEFSQIVLSIVPTSLQPIFRVFFRITSFQPVNQVLNLMKDGWHLILQGSAIGIRPNGYFQEVSRSKRREELMEKIENVIERDEKDLDGKPSSGSIRRRDQVFPGFGSSSLTDRKDQSSFPFSNSHSNSDFNSRGKRKFDEFTSKHSNLRSYSTKSSNSNQSPSPKPGPDPAATSSAGPSPSKIPSKNWLAAMAALILIPTCYLLGAALHEYREVSQALGEEERIRKSNLGLSEEEIQEKRSREESEEEARRTRGLEGEREAKLKSLELAHYHLSHEKQEVLDKLARLRERRAEEQEGKGRAAMA